MDLNALTKLADVRRQRIDDLRTNPTPRVALGICAVLSGTMLTIEGGYFQRTGKTTVLDGHVFDVATGGISRLNLLEDGLQSLYQAIREDSAASYSAEVAVVSFNDRAACLQDFSTLDRQTRPPKLKAEGNTAMGEGLNLTLDLLEQRKQEFKDNGVDYYQPMLVLLSDGEPSPGPQEEAELARAEQRIRELTSQRKLTVLSVGIGGDANMNVLRRFSSNNKAYRLNGLRFQDFFKWLGKSVVKTSQSLPGDRQELDISDISSWEAL